MKLLTWNVNHRIREKPIPDTMAEALASLSPDVIVLTEYVPGPSREKFLSELKSQGYAHKELSHENGEKTGQNHILIASRTPLEKLTIDPPALAPAFPYNVLKVHVEKPGVDILGLRMPTPLSATEKNACWDWIEETARGMRDRPSVILGDFNNDTCRSGANGRIRFDHLTENGWERAPATGISWWADKGTSEGRLDHAFLSRHFTDIKAEYKPEYGPYVFARKPGALSDHAVLVVDADLKL
jgi:endonuclease/exonuclease/phosphatase family metal-dependent hydrolase